MNKPEEWKDIPSFAGYQVSNLGQIRSLDRTIQSAGRTVQRKGKVLKPGQNKDGYQVIGLSIAGVTWTRLVHEVVASVYLGERPDGYQIHHRNTRRNDNRLSNLIYRPFGQHMLEHFTGAANPAAKLTDARVIEIKQLLDQGIAQQVIAKYVGVNQAVISRIKRGKAWSHVKPPAANDLFLSFTLDSITELAF